MKIHYKKRQLLSNLLLGIVWLVYFSILFFTKDNLGWTDYGWLLISLSYFSVYAYQIHYQFLTIENGILKINTLFGKRIALAEIKSIKKFAGDYILSTDRKKLTINTAIIAPESLSQLDSALKKLNVEWH